MPTLATDWNSVSYNGGGIIASNTERVRISWGDGTVESAGINIDTDGDGTNDAIAKFHSWSSDGVYDVVVRNIGSVGFGEAIYMRASVFASETNARTATGGNYQDLLITGSGNDRITSAGGGDLVAANEGNDTVLSGDGNDFVLGGDGDDLLKGGTGSDLLVGNEGNDYIAGEAGTGSLYGDGGNDKVIGGVDFDFISGGTGRDTLTGGGNGDIFDFDRGDSGLGGDRDTITDFNVSTADFIDLSDFGGLAFIGKERFHSLGEGQVRYVVSGGRTIVQVDDDGNGRPDFEIGLTGGMDVTQDNFFL